MIRTLSLIAVVGFVLSIGCLAGAAALGWHGFARHFHNWPHNWTVDVDDHGHGFWRFRHDDDNDAAAGPAATKEIAWNNGDRLDLDLDANVQFTQAPGPGKLVITGPKNALDHIVVEGSELKFNDDGDYDGQIKVVMTAPQVRHFAINGAGDLSIDAFDQDALEVAVSGSGDVTAKGKAHDVKLNISGNGDADLGGVATDSAEADISGSGRATIAPTASADLSISGSGDIDLKTHPAKVSSNVSGSGKISEGGQDVTSN